MTPQERAKCYEVARGENDDEKIARLKANCGTAPTTQEKPE